VTPLEADRFRELLVAERGRIAGAIASFRDDNHRNVDDEVGALAGVGADTASITFDRELDEGLEEGAQQTLAQIDRALQRLDDGTYGTCERCGNPIREERLQVRPWATLCIDDQRLADRG
jgi:RNA polymerase-binding transcription factor